LKSGSRVALFKRPLIKVRCRVQIGKITDVVIRTAGRMPTEILDSPETLQRARLKLTPRVTQTVMVGLKRPRITSPTMHRLLADKVI
jgi:uncharacterized protein (DUF1778 family)